MARFDRITAAALRLRCAAVLTVALALPLLIVGETKGQAIDPFLVASRGAQPGVASHAYLDGRTAAASPVVQTSTFGPPPPVNGAIGFTPTAGQAYPIEPSIGQAFGPTYGPYDAPSGAWGWELLPDGIIYRNYLAGPRESRLGLHTFHNDTFAENSEWTWDATLGGRRGIFRYGNNDPMNPAGWQLDIEGATIVRLNLEEDRDVDASDFRFGVPLTYTDGGPISYKMGYYHLSSHLGDELIARTGVNNRINYVRDALIFGVSYQANRCWRIYGETAYAFFTAGGAEPWEFQIGAEYSKPGPTGFSGTPFFATNAHLHEELNFGGDWTLQAGWLWRGDTGSTFRLGLHYMNGKSTQYQFFTQNEEQIGLGIWYDF